MKKGISVLILALFVFSMTTNSLHAEDTLVQKDNAVNKISDWAHTIGKDKTKRDQILAERKAERQKKHLAKKAEQMKKDGEKKAKEMGKDAEQNKDEMKKKMGL